MGLFDEKRENGVEHLIQLGTKWTMITPAISLYNEKFKKDLAPILEEQNIYLIGHFPILEVVEASLKENKLKINYSVLGNNYTIENDLDEGFTLTRNKEIWILESPDIGPFSLLEPLFYSDCSDICKHLNFKILYIGQAFGRKYKQNAFQRLNGHEKLQEIFAKEAPLGYTIQLSLLSLAEPESLTLFNPIAKHQQDNRDRFDDGSDFLNKIKKSEVIDLYEASLIRYFAPEYNVQHKKHFPKKTTKLVKNLYEHDYAAIHAVLDPDIDFMTYSSNTIDPKPKHRVVINLHQEIGRDFASIVDD